MEPEVANILTGVFIFFLLVGAFVIYANKKIAERDAQLKPKKLKKKKLIEHWTID